MATLVTLVDGTVPVAADFNGNFTALNAELRPPTTGGTGLSTYVTGDLLYASATNTLSRLAAGSTGLGLVMTAGVPAWGVGSAGPPTVRGLTGFNNAATPTSKFDLAATYVTLRNPTTGATRTVAAVSATNDIAVATTANGRDQAAAFTASSWVYYYFTGTGSGAVTTLSSASSTGPTLPSGMTEWALAGAVGYDAAPRLIATAMVGAWMNFTTSQAVLVTGAATTQTAVSMTTTVPPCAARYQLGLRGVVTQSKTLVVRVSSGADYLTIDSLNGTTNPDLTVDVPNLAQTLYYVNGSTTCSLSIDVLGYSVPNGDG